MRQLTLWRQQVAGPAVETAAALGFRFGEWQVWRSAFGVGIEVGIEVDVEVGIKVDVKIEVKIEIEIKIEVKVKVRVDFEVAVKIVKVGFEVEVVKSVNIVEN